MWAPILPTLPARRDRCSRPQSEERPMRIRKHEKSYIVELEDDSAWRIWPGDLATSLHWMPSTRFEVSEIDDECCTHALIDRTTRTSVRVIEAAAAFAPEQIEASLVS